MKDINGNVHRLWMQAAIVLTALLLALGTTPAPPRTAWASVLAQDPDPPPSIADGVWEGVMVSDSRFSAPGAGGGANFRGEMRFTSSGGILDGSWSVIGTGTVSGDYGVGTAEYTSAGGDPYWAWDGTATSVYLGGSDTAPREESAGPVLSDGMSWVVMGFDGDNRLVGSSVLRPISP